MAERRPGLGGSRTDAVDADCGFGRARLDSRTRPIPLDADRRKPSRWQSSTCGITKNLHQRRVCPDLTYTMRNACTNATHLFDPPPFFRSGERSSPSPGESVAHCVRATTRWFPLAALAGTQKTWAKKIRSLALAVGVLTRPPPQPRPLRLRYRAATAPPPHSSATVVCQSSVVDAAAVAPTTRARLG